MKHGVLLVGLLFCVAGARAQNDYLANDPIWTVTATCSDDGMCVSYDHFNYFINGDSVLGGFTYKKVWRAGTITYAGMGGGPCTGIGSYGIGYYGPRMIRQAGSQLRMWDDGDTLLHEFDLHVGDMVPPSWTNWGTDAYVIAVDSVLIGTEWRKRFELANAAAQYLVEGVGSSAGLFEPIMVPFDCGYMLDCFGLGNVGYYPTPGPSCDLAMQLPQASGPRISFSVAPNPATNTLSVLCSSDADRMEISDLFGRTLSRERYVRDRPVDIRNLPAGTYALRLFAAGGAEVGAVRFVKE